MHVEELEALRPSKETLQVLVGEMYPPQRVISHSAYHPELEGKEVEVILVKNGAYFSDGTKYLFMGVYPHTPFERTGAGDAFSSTFTCAIALGKSIEEALRWAPINSMSVVQQIGAQRGLLTREKLEDYLAKAPADYQPKEI
jgi:sugar/nucleoside kinase (ribokinase family)